MPRGAEKTTQQSPSRATPDDDPASDSTMHVLARAQRGDRAAVYVLLERAAPVLRRWARGRLPAYARNDANTEDVVQDAVVATLRNIGRFRHRTVGGLQAYLRISVISRVRDLIRRSGRRGVHVQVSDELADEQRSPLELVIMRQGLDRFLEALQRLSPKDRQVIIWRVELGYSVAEIAARLGKSIPAAGMTVTRAMTRLAQQLDLPSR